MEKIEIKMFVLLTIIATIISVANVYTLYPATTPTTSSEYRAELTIDGFVVTKPHEITAIPSHYKGHVSYAELAGDTL